MAGILAGYPAGHGGVVKLWKPVYNTRMAPNPLSSVTLLLWILAFVIAVGFGHQYRKNELVRQVRDLEFQRQELENRAKAAEQELWQCKHQANYRK